MVENPRLTVLGAGSWGTALAALIARNGVPTRLWGRDREALAAMASSRCNKRYLPDIELPLELGNKFALVLLSLPTGERTPLLRLEESKHRMDAIKHSPEAALTFGLLATMGRSGPEVERRLIDFFSAKAIGVTTNVMGPQRRRYMAGSPIAGVLSWAPGSGNQTLNVAIFSYNRTVRVGFKADATVVPDVEKLVHAFEAEMDQFTRLARAA